MAAPCIYFIEKMRKLNGNREKFASYILFEIVSQVNNSSESMKVFSVQIIDFNTVIIN